MAAKSLPAGLPSPDKVSTAREILRQTDFLRSPDQTAQLTRGPDNAFYFPSHITTALPRNDTVHGKLFLAGKSWANRPFVILVHGWNAELHYLYILPFVARALNRHGLNAALIELPLHLHRRPLAGNVMRDFISDDLPGMLLATRQAIADVHGLGKWAQAQGCPSVAIWGFSLGAWLAGLYICESALPAAAVLTTPISDLATAVRELSFCHPIRSSLNGTTLDLTPLNLTHHRPLIAPEAIQVMQSSYDLFAPAESYRDLAAAWRLNDWEKQPQGHISVLTSRRAMNNSIHWLEKRLRQKRAA
ncbi:MAG: alpha/beta hydrolase family protein [Limisphaerales bacterium]